MKKFFLLFSFLLILVCCFIIGSNLLSSHPVSENDQKSIAQTVNNYYEALENNKFDKALSYIYEDKKDLNNYINLQSSGIALNEVFQNIITEFHIDNLCNYQYVFYDNYEKAYNAQVNLNLKYKNTPGGLIKESLYLNKYNGQWKIVKIKSADRYVIFRSNNYNVDANTWFLIPSKQ